jgi:hypothetical protein
LSPGIEAAPEWPRRRSWAGLGIVVVVSLTALVAIRYDWVPGLRGPAPYPPEWQWRHRPHALAKALPALPLALGLIALLAASGRPLARRHPRGTAGILLGAGAVLGLLFPLALLESEAGGAVAHLVSRSASPAYFSYLTVAVSPAADDAGALLRDYPAHLPDFPMHAATHPPGPVLFYKGLLAALSKAPQVEAPLRRAVARACGERAERCSGGAQALAPLGRSAALAGAIRRRSGRRLVGDECRAPLSGHTRGAHGVAPAAVRRDAR